MPPPLRRLVSRVTVVCIGVIAAAWPAAQTASTPQQPDPRQTFRTEANFVRVDTYPTRDGKPVLDLAATDFELFEDGVAQKITTFEHVVVRAAGSQADRIEPSSQREMLEAAANPRHRVFVIFLDAPNVGVSGSHDIAEPLIRLINRILGPDDLVGVMTPGMSAAEVVLARRTAVTEEQLRKHWTWGNRFGLTKDEREEAYLECYRPLSGEGAESALARAMIARKRERATLEALQDLVRYLGGVREERKAILAITEGWVLYTPDPSLEALRTDPRTGYQDPVPGVDPVGVGPNGKLTTKDPRNRTSGSQMECDADRQRLASMDDERFLRDIINDANRTNASFYPVDPRGLPVFDTPIQLAVPLAADAKLLRTRLDSMRTLAESTDGIAVLNSNDLEQGLRKISDDLSSYYLLGYYSTNAKVDGSYRALKVRVKRPGVDVRARRGYRAATTEEVARALKAAAAPGGDTTTAVETALATLSNIRPEARLRLHATMAHDGTSLWVTGELTPGTGRQDEWSQGGTANLQVTDGNAVSTSQVTIKPGERTFVVWFKQLSDAAAQAGVGVQARVTSGDGSTPVVTESLRVSAPARPLFYRRGPTTANRQVLTADLRFTRSDRVHLELPVSDQAELGLARLLDRTGQPLSVPVTVAERTEIATFGDTNGLGRSVQSRSQRWLTADIVLAPLAPGDYLVELTTKTKDGEGRVLAGLRVVR